MQSDFASLCVAASFDKNFICLFAFLFYFFFILFPHALISSTTPPWSATAYCTGYIWVIWLQTFTNTRDTRPKTLVSSDIATFKNIPLSLFTKIKTISHHGASSVAHHKDVLEASGEYMPRAILDRHNVKRTRVPVSERRKKMRVKCDQLPPSAQPIFLHESYTQGFFVAIIASSRRSKIFWIQEPYSVPQVLQRFQFWEALCNGKYT